jgi:hypothetical protein
MINNLQGSFRKLEVDWRHIIINYFHYFRNQNQLPIMLKLLSCHILS